MNLDFVAQLKRPEHVFRPARITRRLIRKVRSSPPQYETVQLPWGLPIRIQPNELVGSRIWRFGVHELPSCECISRLIDPGEIGVDAGANIGQMTSIMARRAGPTGKVIAFEPHPVLFKELQYNVAAWTNEVTAPIAIHKMALSNQAGVAQLVVPSKFAGNHGCCFLGGNPQTALRGNHVEVPVGTLQTLIDEKTQISFLKLDVEGHELQLLEGALNMIASGNIRDILFEEFGTPPTSLTRFLEDNGYTLYRVGDALVKGGKPGPVLTSVRTPDARAVREEPNYIATRDPGRVLARMSTRGWMIYSNKW
jgi:FkbM family methyltransferase